MKPIKVFCLVLVQMFAAIGCTTKSNKLPEANNSIREAIAGCSVVENKVAISAEDGASRYLDAVIEFADNVLKHGRDTYGPKHTPLFVDGLNIHTHEPVKWIAPNGDRWILSNLASQQNLFRTLDGLTRITGDPKYKQAAMDAIRYAFDNLRSPNGLLYWGEGSAYDAQGEKACGLGLHSLKASYPCYELMWEVNPEATVQFIESMWASHILDWSNLDLNRVALLDRLSVPKGWDHEYVGGLVPFESKLVWSMSFCNTASDLYYAAVKLSKFSGQDKPLTWAKRLAHRYIETRDPRTGISCSTFTFRNNTPKHPLADDFKGHAVHFGAFLFYPAGGDPLVHPIVNRCILHDFICSPGVYSDSYFGPWICQLKLGEVLGKSGNNFKQWALEEFSAWGKVAYRKQTNSWIPMLTDGTSLEGYLLQRDTYLGIKGTVFKGYKAGCTDFWAYALAHKITGDNFMWQMARNIAIGNNFGDIGADCQEEPELRFGTNCSHPHAILGFLALYESTEKRVFLEMARNIGDNILTKRFHKGFFAPSKKHIYAKFDAIESFILLHLYTALSPECPSLLSVWPARVRFCGGAYRDKNLAFDNTLIYTLTESSQPSISLNEAAAIGSFDLAKSLIAEGADVDNREDPTFNTPLHRAAMNGHKSVVELLITKGARIDAEDTLVGTPLHYAAERGHKQIAELLIAKGANVNAKNYNGQTPVDVAISRNHKEIVELLVENGADVSLHAAARFGDIAIVKNLIEKVDDINAKDTSGCTALHYAAEEGHKDVVELLIANGADINARNNDGQTALDIALKEAHLDITKILLAKGAEVTEVSIHNAAFMGAVDKVKDFLEQGCSVDIADAEGRTALHYAAGAGEMEMVEFLIAKCADINAKDNRSFTPLHEAVRGRHKNVVALLIDSGADVNAKSRWDYTPIYYAAWSGSTEVVELLVESGADINVKDEWGWTPLHYMARHGYYRDMAEFLLAKGADANAKDNDGITPLQVAKEKGHTEIVELLRKHGAQE